MPPVPLMTLLIVWLPPKTFILAPIVTSAPLIV